jgi:hypothetical protein
MARRTGVIVPVLFIALSTASRRPVHARFSRYLSQLIIVKAASGFCGNGNKRNGSTTVVSTRKRFESDGPGPDFQSTMEFIFCMVSLASPN